MKPHTLAQAAALAIACQDGCNLSGILKSFHEIVQETLWPAARERGLGAKWINEHPICTLFLDKLSDLNHRVDFGPAYDACERLATGETEVV